MDFVPALCMVLSVLLMLWSVAATLAVYAIRSDDVAREDVRNSVRSREVFDCSGVVCLRV